jgi:hypothetical protein
MLQYLIITVYFCTTLVTIAQGNIECIIKKRYLTSEVATDQILLS